MMNYALWGKIKELEETNLSEEEKKKEIDKWLDEMYGPKEDK